MTACACARVCGVPRDSGAGMVHAPFQSTISGDAVPSTLSVRDPRVRPKGGRRGTGREGSARDGDAEIGRPGRPARGQPALTASAGPLAQESPASTERADKTPEPAALAPPGRGGGGLAVLSAARLAPQSGRRWRPRRCGRRQLRMPARHSARPLPAAAAQRANGFFSFQPP